MRPDVDAALAGTVPGSAGVLFRGAAMGRPEVRIDFENRLRDGTVRSASVTFEAMDPRTLPLTDLIDALGFQVFEHRPRVAGPLPPSPGPGEQATTEMAAVPDLRRA